MIVPALTIGGCSDRWSEACSSRSRHGQIRRPASHQYKCSFVLIGSEIHVGACPRRVRVRVRGRYDPDLSGVNRVRFNRLALRRGRRDDPREYGAQKQNNCRNSPNASFAFESGNTCVEITISS